MATLALDTLYNFADYYAAKIRLSTLAGNSTSRINVVFKHPTGGASFPDFTQGIQANGTAGELVIQWSKADNKIRGSRNSVAGTPVDIPWLTVTGVKFQFTSNNTAAVVTAPVAQVITFALPLVQVEESPGVFVTQTVKLIEELKLLDGTVVSIKSIPVALSASSTSGLTAFTFSSSDATAATITSGNILAYIDVTKTPVITASQSGDDNWLPASATITLSPDGNHLINSTQTPQTIDLTVVSPLSIGQQAAFTASASSGLPVDVSSTDTDVATISNGKLVAVAPGNVLIVAVQEGNATYAKASVGKLVVVNKTPQTITFPTDLSEVKVGDQLQLTASSSSGLPVTFLSSDNFVAAVSDSVLYVRSQGAASITASQRGSDIYATAQVTKTITIGASNQTINFPEMAARSFDSPDFALGAFASSNLPLTYNSSSPLVATISSEGDVSIHGVGSTFITVSQAGNTYWQPATSVQRLFTVEKAKQTISFSEVPSQINISEKVLLKGTSSSGGAVTFFVSGAALKLTEESGNFYITGTAEGEGTVTATAAGDANYEAVSVDFDVAVGRQAQEIVFPLIEPRTFSFRSFSLTASATSGLPVSFSSSAPAVASVSAGGLVTVNKAGVTTITASQPGNSEWLAATSLQRILAIDKGEQQISFFPPAPVPSTTTSIVLSASAPGGAVVFKSSNPQVVEMNGSVAVIKGVGLARIVATQAGSGDYMPAVAGVPIFVVPVIDSVAAPSNSIIDQEPHDSTAVSPSTSALAVVMGTPSTLDREVHDSLLISPTLNMGDVVPPNTVLDQSAFSSREASTIFTGTSQTLSGGSDHESYLAGVSSAFSGAPVTVGAAIEEDLSSYASVASVADHAASECVRAKYDGRDSFEVYLASFPSAPEGYLLIRGGAYLLWGRTNEDGAFFTGKLII